jgi:hypothetical protein
VPALIVLALIELVSLLVTGALVWLSLWWLKRREEQAAGEESDTSRNQNSESTRAEGEDEENKSGIQIGKGWFKCFEKRSKVKTADLESLRRFSGRD